MEYSDEYNTPTPAQSKKHANPDKPSGSEDDETAGENEMGDEEAATPEEGRSRGRKRLRVRSPKSEDGQSWEGEGAPNVGDGVSGSGGKSAGERDERATQSPPSQPQAVTKGALGTADKASEAPPPYPTLPPPDECEKMIEEVVQEAAANLRDRLRKLVEGVRGGAARDSEQAQPMSQETFDYWQFCADPSEALIFAEAMQAEQTTGGATSGLADGTPSRTSLIAFPDIQYDDMPTLYAKATMKAGLVSSGPAQQKQESTTAPWDQGIITANELRTAMAKGKERQRDPTPDPMEVDKPAWRQAAPADKRTPRTQVREYETGGAGSTGPPGELGREEAEERRREALKKMWDEANFEEAVAGKEVSGQPEHRRGATRQELDLALSLCATREHEIAKLGLAPIQEEGNPAVHANSPRDRVRNIPDSKLKEWRTLPPRTYVLLDVYGEGDIEDGDPQKIYNNLQEALAKITGLANVSLEQPPRTPRGVSKEHATTVWLASGLYPAAVALLTMVHAWPTADITFFAYKEIEFIPRYLFAIKGFTQSDPDEVRLAVWKIFHKSPIYPSIHDLVQKNPDYVKRDHEQVTNEILRSIEVIIRPVNEEKHARLITHVYMTSPTRSAATWEAWRDGLRYPLKGRPFSKEHPHLEISQRITHCKACHGADHLTTQCPYGHLEGWDKVVEGAYTRRPDQWRTRSGQSLYANEQSAPPEDRNGGDGWNYVEGRGGARGRTTRGGGGIARGAQPRGRRG
ncbi:hypothetical protein OH77DRAFT_1573757 [Trametes cingulata]|nr:hypothetical protein OH77DRAFT_1573757 [Trametes cingulata]